MPVALQTILLLIASNVFMTFAWDAHLRNLSAQPWWIAALVSWFIALFEYPAHTQLIADVQRDLLAGSTS